MSPSTNARSGPTTSTEATTITTSPSPYVTQNDFSTTITNTIKYLLANFDDKNAKKDAKFKETIEETITDQYAKFNAKSEKQLQTLSLHIKEYSKKFSFKT